MASKKSKGISRGKIIAGAGAGLAAAAAIAAGANYFYGRDGKKHRKGLQVIVNKAKVEALKDAKKLKVLNEKAYHGVATAVAKRYKELKKVSPAEVAALVGELKGHWNTINKQLNSAKKVVSKTVAKATKAQPKKKTAARKK